MGVRRFGGSGFWDRTGRGSAIAERGGYRKLTANEGGGAGVSRVLQRRMGRSGEFPSDTTKTLCPPSPSDFNKSFLFQ